MVAENGVKLSKNLFRKKKLKRSRILDIVHVLVMKREKETNADQKCHKCSESTVSYTVRGVVLLR